MLFYGYGYHGRSFERSIWCYPASFIDKPQIENGDKIIMPSSTLDRLDLSHIDYPVLFELRNASTKRVSHYGMMENLFLQEGDIVTVKNVTLPKGKYTTLRNFSCLIRGDSIMVAYNNKKYYIDIVETEPSNGISIIETDCEVDFAPPLDYKEPERTAPSRPSKAPAEGSSDKEADVTNGGKKSAVAPSSQTSSRQSQGKLVFGSNANHAPEKQKEPGKEEPQKKEPKFQPFSGKKVLLEGLIAY
ncbi:unnamed protein product [Withania somnifera]